MKVVVCLAFALLCGRCVALAQFCDSCAPNCCYPDCCVEQKRNLSIWKQSVSGDTTTIINTTDIEESMILRAVMTPNEDNYFCGFMDIDMSAPLCPIEVSVVGVCGAKLQLQCRLTDFTSCPEQYDVCERSATSIRRKLTFSARSLMHQGQGHCELSRCLPVSINSTGQETDDTTGNEGNNPITDGGNNPTADGGNGSSTDGGNGSSTDGGDKPTTDGGDKPTTDGGNGSSTDEGSDSTGSDSTAAIVGGILGGLIVLIMAALLALQIIRLIGKRRRQRHNINAATNITNTMTTENGIYNSRPPLPPEPKTNGILGLDSPTLHLRQPSPYETATSAMKGVYSVLQPSDEKENQDQLNRTTPNHYAEQHLYEETDRYVSSPRSAVVNADYEVAVKSTLTTLPKTNSKSHTDADDYANPDDALFDDPKYDIQPTTKRQSCEKSSKAKAPISTGFTPVVDESDYTIPDDAILAPVATHPHSPQTKETVESVLSPLYHELGKSEEETEKPQEKNISAGERKGEVVTVEAVTYESAVSKTRSKTSVKTASNNEPPAPVSSTTEAAAPKIEPKASVHSQDPESDTATPQVKDGSSSEESGAQSKSPLQKMEDGNINSPLNLENTNSSSGK